MGISGTAKELHQYMGSREYVNSYRKGELSGRNAGSVNDDLPESSVKDAFYSLVQKEHEEFEERIRTGSWEPSFQIGANSFTEREWTKLIKSVDAAQDEMRKAAEREKEMQEERQQDKTQNTGMPDIIVYDADGIRCIDAESGICLWFIRFTEDTQYFKVQEYMENTGKEGDPSSLSSEGFWKEMLR